MSCQACGGVVKRPSSLGGMVESWTNPSRAEYQHPACGGVYHMGCVRNLTNSVEVFEEHRPRSSSLASECLTHDCTEEITGVKGWNEHHMEVVAQIKNIAKHPLVKCMDLMGAAYAGYQLASNQSFLGVGSFLAYYGVRELLTGQHESFYVPMVNAIYGTSIENKGGYQEVVYNPS